MPMTPDAKRLLSRTIRDLRKRLIDDLGDALQQTYQLALTDPALDDEGARTRRRRLDAWLDEQQRAHADEGKNLRDRLLGEVVDEAASTWLNRLVFLRLMEGFGQRKECLLTGGWSSEAYRGFQEVAPALRRGDDALGFDLLLRLAVDELSIDLPGLFGDVGLVDLVPLPVSTLRAVIEAFDKEELKSCWSDDMTLGWVYQYWNDPRREELDKKIARGEKIENHEIASKTQMFTERYMVDWLLQNSLGPLWFALCKKHGWTPDVVSSGAFARLEERRVDWRGKRDRGEVSLTDLMPLYDDVERRWVYTLTNEVPPDSAPPDSIRDVRLLDPACGSGHFLVVAFDLLLPLYEEEARHRGEAGDARWSRRAVVEHILEHNLHGVDIDPRAVQIAAAALWLKARVAEPTARPRQLQLVAPALDLDGLSDTDPALSGLLDSVYADTGLPHALMLKVVRALAGADHQGSLLRVDEAVAQALAEHAQLSRPTAALGRLFVERDGRPVAATPDEQFDRKPLTPDAAQERVLSALEAFLTRHQHGQDLGLRLMGEQLAAGVRFIRMIREDRYDLVVGNPPYQGTSKMADAAYVAANYALGKADLYAAFLLRGLQLVKPGGTSALLTMRNWMFIAQYAELRKELLERFGLRALLDLASGAFEEIAPAQVVVSVVGSVFCRGSSAETALADRAFDEKTVTQVGETDRKRAALLAGIGRMAFQPAALRVVPEWPVVYWLQEGLIKKFGSVSLVGEHFPAIFGATTGDNVRYCRLWFETDSVDLSASYHSSGWVPFVNGAKGRRWMEDLREVFNWVRSGLDYRTFSQTSPGANFRNYEFQFVRGIAFSMMGVDFSARAHRFRGIFGNKGSSVFPAQSEIGKTVCAMNAGVSNRILQALNPGIGFEVGDVNRLPLFPIANADDIFATIESAFTVHESHREPSVEFRQPGPSPWTHAQAWAQTAVDRPEGAPLPLYAEQLDPEPATDHVSYALGVALGRFGPHGEGVRDPAKDDLSFALPDGLLLLDSTAEVDDLSHAACAPLREAWDRHRAAIDPKRTLHAWLRERFFELHRKMYENRPIHWPLSSAKKTFVAWVNIHRMTDNTLRRLEVRLSLEALPRLEGLVNDLREHRRTGDEGARGDAERKLELARAQLDELRAFLADLHACSALGPPPTDPRCPPREVDAAYVPDLDDGVMIHSAGLWPLLTPQWKDPKTWWAELAAPGAKADYDWSHLAMRYWPTRVDTKCRKDPSLGVAHGCFWRYHPERAWAWELRLQDEIGPDFRITEGAYPQGSSDPGEAPHRRALLDGRPEVAIDAVKKELVRRRRKHGERVEGITLLETGLWTALPGRLAAIELELSDTWDTTVSIDAPDAEAAYAAWERDKPADVATVLRGELLRRWAAKKKKERHTVTGLWYDRARLWLTSPALAAKLEHDLSKMVEHRVRLHHPGSDEARAAWSVDSPEWLGALALFPEGGA